MSARETILAALLATLSGLCSGRVYRSRKEQLPALPAIVIRPESEKTVQQVLGCHDATLTVVIEIYARGDVPDQAADATLQAVIEALQATPTLGLSDAVQVSPDLEYEWAIENYDDAGITLRLVIDYRI